MRKFDRQGLEIAMFQAELFEASLIRSKTSSPIFLRRFFLSDFADKMDYTPVDLQAFSIPDAFYYIEKQYGSSTYGKMKYSPESLYWLGYFTRYVCYTRETPSRLFYRLFDVKQVCSLYEAYHTQGEEWCLAHLLESYGYSEADLDINERLKKIMKRGYQKKLTSK